MLVVFIMLAAVLVWLSFKSFLGGIAYLRFFKNELSKTRPEWTPFATVIAPCKGLDDGIEENLSALFNQHYPDYEVIFVVDDMSDASVAVIEEILRKAATDVRKARFVVAPKAVASAQKIESLLEAMLHSDARSEIFVFVDSDARPPKHWLRYLVAPLANEAIGAATGYRWFISRSRNFASEMRVVWNASIASALGPNTRSNFCWGGSTAIKREMFERLNVRDRWHGALADDLSLTRAVKENGLSIAFVPQALLPSIEDCTFRALVEFTTRQMKITRVYAPSLWLMTLFGTALFNGVMITAFLIVLFSPTNSAAFVSAFATLLLVSIFSIGKASLRLAAVRLCLAEYEREIKAQFWPQNTLWLISPLLFFYNSIAALTSRRLTWRGTTYELKSASETVIIAE